MKDNSFALFLYGILTGGFACVVLIVFPLCNEYKEMQNDAVSAGVARFNPQTSKFEFIQRQGRDENPKKSPIPGEKNLTQVEDLL
tara:strand:+ start:275 stop:529 length:255 start_codon:yes stop_codon:yes gene_type:complete